MSAQQHRIISALLLLEKATVSQVILLYFIYATGFLYDAVISIGLGACLAQREDEKVSGSNHVEGIRLANFTGATGQVAFGAEDGDEDRNGTRLASTVYWGAFNVIPPSQPDDFALTDILSPDSSGAWFELQPFVYRDGRTVPPDYLRDEPDQNYLNSGLRALGFALMSVAMFAAVVSALWVYLRRKHRVLRASQPFFLYLLCFGALVQVSAIVTISFDESYGWDEEQLSRACMATPWLLSLGHIIVYASLFTKMWRVNQVLQFSRRRILIRHVAWPMLVLVLLDLLLLSLLTALDPLTWQRTEINEDTGESFGQCDSQHHGAFIAVLVVLSLVPAAMTGFFAWKTKDVDEAYTESWWIAMMILVQLEVVLVSIPLLVLLRDVSTNGRYLGYVIMLWTFPMSALAFIILPKYRAYRQAIRGPVNNVRSSRRGEQAGVRVSGISSTVAVRSSVEEMRSRCETSGEQLPSGSELSKEASDEK